MSDNGDTQLERHIAPTEHDFQCIYSGRSVTMNIISVFQFHFLKARQAVILYANIKVVSVQPPLLKKPKRQ